MARVISKVYDFVPTATWLNWDEAPDPPEDEDLIWEPDLDWNHPDWDKSYGGCMVTASLREELFESFRVFPNFQAPILLDLNGFRKFCFLASNDYAPSTVDLERAEATATATATTTSRPLCLTEWPSNYLPIDYRDDPLGWTWKRFKEREARKNRQLLREAWYSADDGDDDSFSSDDSDFKHTSSTPSQEEEDDLFVDSHGYLVKSNDRVRLINYQGEVHLNGTIGTAWYLDPQAHRSDHVTVFMPSISEDTAISISIQNLCKFVLSGSVQENNQWKNFPSKKRKDAAGTINWSLFPRLSRLPLVLPKVDEDSHQFSGLTLLDLSRDLQGHIASYLDTRSLQHGIRRTSKEAFWNFQPPPMESDYDALYFAVASRRHIRHGVAYTVEDLVPFLLDWLRQEKLNDKTYEHQRFGAPCRLTLRFLKVPDWSSHSILPLLSHATKRPKRHRSRHHRSHPLVEVDRLGHRDASVRMDPQIQLNDQVLYLEALDQEEAPHEVCLQTLKRARTLRPTRRGGHKRYSDTNDDTTDTTNGWMPLTAIGSRLVDCKRCGKHSEECACLRSEGGGPGGSNGLHARIYYSPTWYEKQTKEFSRVRFFDSPIEWLEDGDDDDDDSVDASYRDEEETDTDSDAYRF